MNFEVIFELGFEALDIRTFVPLSLDGSGDTERYFVSFKIILHPGINFPKIYEVWFFSGFVGIKCDVFMTEVESLRYINRAMKLAAKSQFLYQVCSYCNQDVFYPLLKCEKCMCFLQIQDKKWKIKKEEIEKTSKHIGLFMNNGYRT
jgi:hypothetical protein